MNGSTIPDCLDDARTKYVILRFPVKPPYGPMSSPYSYGMVSPFGGTLFFAAFGLSIVMIVGRQPLNSTGIVQGQDYTIAVQ